MGIIGLLGFMAIIAAWQKPDGDSFNRIKETLNILLPVFGAWVGTVLAYYFSKENFAAATRALATQLTPEEKLKSIPAKDVMIPIDKATKLVLDNKKEDNIKLKDDIIDKYLNKVNRLPFLDSNGRIKYMAHRSLIDKFIVQEVSKNKTLTDLTLQEMLNDAESAKMLKEGFGIVRETSNLADAKALIDRITICLDVFVTEDGTANTKVLGWITNVIILEQSKL